MSSTTTKTEEETQKVGGDDPTPAVPEGGEEKVGDGDGDHDWLEEVASEPALDWVRGQNKDTLSRLGNPEDCKVYDKVLAILDSKEKIPTVYRRDDWFYNFYQDEDHQQGIWRRTTLDSFCTKNPEWQTMLDLDALSKEENETWVWHGSSWLFEGVGVVQDTCMIKLSKGGADAVVAREYDVANCRFFAPGKDVFALPEAKMHISYKSRDVLLVATDFGEGSLTKSGYARTVKEWRRGTPLEEATLVFEGKEEDVIVHGYSQFCRGHTYQWNTRAMTFWTSEQYVRETTAVAAGGEEPPMQKVEVPEDAQVSAFGSFLFVELRSDWDLDGTVYKQGSFLSFNLRQFMAGDRSSIQALFEPDADGRVALSSHCTTLNYLILKVLDNVCNRLIFFRRQDAEGENGVATYQQVEVKIETDSQAAGVDAQLSIWAEDEDTSDVVWLRTSGFLQPTSLLRGEIRADTLVASKLKGLPDFYDASGLKVTQSEATSKDGTRIPYFIVLRDDLELNSKQPTLLYGYGGFEIPMLPFYAGKFGAGWLERGGVFVLANIRGGGEFGPAWHQAALKEKRHKAYEDFEAVALDLVDRKICSRHTLGCMGGSNGGLLTGNMLVRSPEKFGAIVCQVPLLDMKRFSHLLAGNSWMGEYGDPDKPEEWEFVKQISPYHNIANNTDGSKPYPNILFTTSTRDDRVHPGHARKMVKRLQENGHAATTFYYENIEGGHGGAANNKQRAFMSTLSYEFLWTMLTKGSSL